MAAEQPKKPTGGSFGRLLAEKRGEIRASMPEGHKMSDVVKKASELFKALGDDEKSKYQALFVKAQAEYKEALEKFKEGGGEVVRKSKKNAKEPRVKPSPDQPKKPSGGAYGRFLGEKREEIRASLPAGANPITDVAKKAGELFKAMSDEDKKKYQDLFIKAQEEYKEALEKFKAGGGEVVRNGKAAKAKTDGGEADTTDEAGNKAKKVQTKRLPKIAKDKAMPKGEAKGKATAKTKAAPKGKVAAGKRGRPAEAPGMELGEAVLKKARDLGYEKQIQNLAKRADVVSSGKSPADLIKALKDCNGLVNPAKRALLGA